ncbi:anti-sigma factor domain-containing protein [Virgibacillus necropolis]|uniref:anti-sigma-I factor RsgI family protein n=1 Tax=Virgibacillus necropolis TaxID=163877 RepID=UPI0038503A36
MSKGIVMEKHRKFTIVMTRDGSFHKVKPVKEAEIGAEVSYEVLASKKSGLLFFQPRKSSSLPVKYIAIACMVLMFVMPFYFFGGQNKTYAYVNLDINPSVEIEIDKDLSVVSISPLNNDARKLIKKLPTYEDKKIQQVIEIIMNKSDALGLSKNGKNVLVGVSYVNNKDISVLNTVDNYFLTHNTSWDVVTFHVPKEVRDRALKKNISMNKVMADTMNDETLNPEKMLLQPRINDDEKEIIHSFYTNSKSNHQKPREEEKVSVDKNDTNHSTVPPQKGKKKTDQHPSELKKKNGYIHSNGKNQHNKSNKADKIKEKHKDKQEMKQAKREKKEAKKEAKQERKEAKKEAKQERKEAKREAKQERKEAKREAKQEKKEAKNK